MDRLIHCIWMGGPKTKLAQKCRASWVRFAPEYTVREWSLSQKGGTWRLRDDAGAEVAIRVPDYVARAYQAKKWAFVSDWLRFVVLEREGGIYFDYDLELVRPLSTALEELDLADIEWCALERMKDGSQGLAPGAGIALVRNSECARRMLAAYANASFDGTTTVGDLMSLADIRLKGVPPDVFCPFDHYHNLRRTERTIAVHHYVLSWISPQRRVAKWLNWHGLGWLTDLLLRFKGNRKLPDARLRICWWTCFPTANQTALVESLRMLGADVVVCYYRSYDEYRRMIGWKDRELRPGECFARGIGDARRQIPDFDVRLQCVPSYAESISWRLIVWCLVHRSPWIAEVERSRGSWRGAFLRKAFAVAVNLGARRLFAIGRLAVEQWRALGVRRELVRWDAYAMPPLKANVAPRLPHRKVRFAYVGALSERKAVDVLAAAWRRVGDAELRVVGDGPLRSCLEGLAGVELCGSVAPEDVQDGIADCDVIVLPSRFDAWGVSLVEGAQLGMAMIASDAVGASELIEPGVNGLVVRAGDVESLAQAMQAYARDPAKAMREGAAACRAVECVSADAVARRLLEGLE